MQESQKMQVWSLAQEDPLEEVMDTPVFLPGESHGQRSLVGYTVHGVTELDTIEWLNTHTHKPLKNVVWLSPKLVNASGCWDGGPLQFRGDGSSCPGDTFASHTIVLFHQAVYLYALW